MPHSVYVNVDVLCSVKGLCKDKGVHGYPFHVFFGGSRDLVVWPYFCFLVFFDKFGHQIFVGASENGAKTVDA